MNAQTEKIIEGYKYHGGRSNLANINAYSACFKHWGRPHVYTPWLYGAIAIPFMFRVGEEVNSAPILNELPHDRIVGLLNNLGVRIDGISAVAEGDELNRLREEAWAAARRAIDAGYTCFGRGFYFDHGETSVVQGYDEASSAYVISCWHDTKYIPWQSLGERDGLIDLHWMTPGGAAEDDRRTVRDALRLAVDFADGKLTGPKTRIGSAAYDHWAAELRQGTVDGWFFAYSTHEWDTCRTNGHKFLLEAKQRLGSGAPEALDDAIVCFGAVREKFNEVYRLFPWEQPRGLIEDTERRLEAAKLLGEAKHHDAAAIEAFRNVVEAL
ncbi:hypothetical protein KZ483_26995 [Paenibacillus sp. sptzw28]|uniref:hypothetical protein n=1 Tax=Paenibacillus sp. sptzw28 TaxID=715179 RepID=UPI001C6EAE13|nr:hypothetical protein [Paenibacillus sp. sptzw28]QYR21285.1 hypothetical protein KZ483_26995 [Paenibacillus sp. sptzw28]